MDMNEKLDWIITTLKAQNATLASVDSKLETISETQELLAENVSDLGKPGSGYSILDPED